MVIASLPTFVAVIWKDYAEVFLVESDGDEKGARLPVGLACPRQIWLYKLLQLPAREKRELRRGQGLTKERRKIVCVERRRWGGGYWPDWCRADWCQPHWCRLIDAGPIDARALLMPIPIDAQLDRLMPDPIDAGPIHVIDKKIQFYCEARPSWCQLSTIYACPDWCRSLLMPGPIDAGPYWCQAWLMPVPIDARPDWCRSSYYFSVIIYGNFAYTTHCE